MNSLKFFKDQVRIETESSKEYAKVALELKESHPRISRMLMEMSEQELKNAEKLQTIMSEYHAEASKRPNAQYTTDDYDGVYSDAIKDYTQNANEIRAMRDVYRRRNNY